MLKHNLWKLVLSVLIVGWALATLLPLNDVPFDQYVKAHATGQPKSGAPTFAKVMSDADAMIKSGHATSVFMALKKLGHERNLDLSQYFPDVRLESTLLNVDKRNDILLNELLRRSKARLQKGLDLAGGISVTLESADNPTDKAKSMDQKEKIAKAIDIIKRRIDAYGVAEPVIRPIGNNRIEIQLPGVSTKDNPDILNYIKAPAKLEFCLVDPIHRPGPGVETPPGYVPMSMVQTDRTGKEFTEEYFIKRIPEMEGGAISDSFWRPNQYGQPEVILRFTSEGRKKFADVTERIADMGKQSGRGGQLAIVLDGKLIDAPYVKEKIDNDSAQISGGAMTDRSAKALSDDLNNPLDVELQVKQQYEVGPSLAADAISSGQRAAIIGTALVAAFMITYYVVGGVVAVITLAMNVLIILGTMASFGATMTLPGIAGIVLTMGMAVDANILIFERMREELKLGKSLKTAVVAGFDKALITIVDAHVTQLCICGVMIWLGTGPIKGFGITLAIGVFSTLFSVLLTSHMIVEWLVDGGIVKRFPMLHFLHPEKVDFVKYGRTAFITSWCIVLLGVATVFAKGHKIYGIDFAGGDVITLTYQQKPDPVAVRNVAASIGVKDITSTFVSNTSDGTDMLRIETPPSESAPLLTALQKQMPGSHFEKIGEESIGPAIGKEIEWNAVKALLWSFAITLLYIALRFEFGFGVGAVVASLHDILMTIGVFVLLGRQFNAPMVAAILSIAGYSINDTVVVFDRIREELKLNPDMKLRDVVNLAMNRVFSRSIMTSVTVFLAALALFIFGTGIMTDLALTFMIGVVTGTFSSIYIASPVFYWWHKGDRKHVEAHADVAPKYEWTGSSKASH